MVYEYLQDDPKKCTAARLVHLQLAQRLHSLRQIPRHSIVLNPASQRTLTPDDEPLASQRGIVALDCSWNRADQIFETEIPGENRRLPGLLAGNPINYSAVGKLSTVEALSASLYILGHKDQALKLLQPFAWGRTFDTLNRELLEAYRKNDRAESLQLDEALMKRFQTG
jgi:pre-rRNA-processing protein TSR3